MISTYTNDIEEEHLMNCGSTDGCAEDLEFYVIWIDLDCLTLSLKMT